MRYLSDDGKVFNTEYECTAHEQEVRKTAEQRDIDYAKLKKKQDKYLEALKDFCDEADGFMLKYHTDEAEGLKSIFDNFFD